MKADKEKKLHAREVVSETNSDLHAHADVVGIAKFASDDQSAAQ